MKAAVFEHQSAALVQEALALLAGGHAKLMAGGQSLGPMLNLRLSRPQLLVDLAPMTELESVQAQGQDLWLGARLTHAAIEDGRHPALAAHPMREVAAGIAYRAIRNKGTIGGSLAHADPAADWVVTLVAMAAVYGGYFGAGLSVILLGVLAITLPDSLLRLNGLKQLLALAANGGAALVFLASGQVAWPPALALALGALVGGGLGGRLAGRLAGESLRWWVVALGTAIGLWFLWR